MMLGQILRELSEASDEEVIATFGDDIVRLARLRTAAEAQGQPLAAYIRDSVCRFLARASEEDWATAVSQMQSDPMPGDRLITVAIEQQLQRDGVSPPERDPFRLNQPER